MTNGKGKTIGLILVILIVIAILLLTFISRNNYIIEEDEGIATAHAFLVALKKHDYDAIAALYHSSKGMDDEKVKAELTPDSIIIPVNLQGEITEEKVESFFRTKAVNGIGYDYGVTFSLTVNGLECSGTLFLLRNAKGYGIDYFVIIPYGTTNDD